MTTSETGESSFKPHRPHSQRMSNWRWSNATLQSLHGPVMDVGYTRGLFLKGRFMKIGIIGSGNVGGALGTRWARAGHSVVFGSRRPESDEMKQLVAKAGATARAAV